LPQFYKKKWFDSGKDIRIRSGASGEGVSYYPGRPDLSEAFSEMVELMSKTDEFVRKSKNPTLMKSPEAIWLTKQKEIGFTNYQRLIFIHPGTWENDSSKVYWAEYVAIDQNLGGLPSEYLTSVLIHEINVNSLGYLATDTHSDYESNVQIWECLSKKGVHELAQTPIMLQRAFGLNAQISVIYLKMILDRLQP